MRTSEKKLNWWTLALAATGGTVGGVLVGAGTALLVAGALGSRESIEHTGLPFYIALSGAWLLGLLGCYFALAALRDPKAVPTVVILALLLPGSTVAAGPLARAFAGWLSLTFGTLISVGMVLIVLLTMLSPIAARALAVIIPWNDRS